MSSEYIPFELKQIFFARAFGMCEYCHRQAKYAVDPFVIDSLQPVSRNGKTIAISNIPNLVNQQWGQPDHPRFDLFPQLMREQFCVFSVGLFLLVGL